VCERDFRSYIGTHQHVRRDGFRPVGTDLYQDTTLPGFKRGIERDRFRNTSCVSQELLSLHFDEDLRLLFSDREVCVAVEAI